MREPSIAELPFADDLLEVAREDLGASRALQQRLLTIQDALLATALTISSLLSGLAFSNDSSALALVAIPLVLAFAYLDGVNWVHFRRVSNRVRSLEGLFHAYVVARRETKTARDQAISRLRNRIDSYQFGIERTFGTPTLKDVWCTNRKRFRWWLYVGLAVVLALCGLLWVKSPKQETICAEADGGAIVALNDVPSPLEGEVTLVPCPGTAAPPSSQGAPNSTAAATSP